MSADLQIVLTAGLVATACGLLGPFLVLRRVALLGDAVSHAVLPGIIATFLLFGTRAPLPVIAGAAVFAVVCVLAIEALRSTGLVKADAAIALVFPALFSLGVLGVTRWTSNLHLDLDATIYGEIAFVPLQQWGVAGLVIPRAVVIVGTVALFNLALVTALWKELKATSFDPEFSRTAGIPPKWLSRVLLVAVAVTAVTAFESVGAILVVTLLIVPAAAAYLLTDRLWVMMLVTVAIGWLSAGAGYAGALRLDASIAGAMGLVAAACFALALILSPRHGLLARRLRRTDGQTGLTWRGRAANIARDGQRTASAPVAGPSPGVARDRHAARDWGGDRPDGDPGSRRRGGRPLGAGGHADV